MKNQNINHTYYTYEDKDVPTNILDGNGEIDLTMCMVCRGVENELPTYCPGVPMTKKQKDKVWGEMIDFINGNWVPVKNKQEHVA